MHAARPLRAIGNYMSLCSWTADEVSWRVPLNSSTLRSMLCCLCCLPAAGALGLLPSASPGKSDYLMRTTGRLSLCSQTLSEAAGRVYVGPKEDPAVAPESLGAHL